MIRLIGPKISSDDGRTVISAQLEGSDRSDALWYSVDAEFGEWLTLDRLDGLMIAALVPAMQRKMDLHVEGTVSERLLHNLNNYYIRILAKVVPGLSPVNVTADDQSSAPISGAANGVATGFSGGVDSFAAITDYFIKPVPDSYRITHLLFNNVGSHGKGGKELFAGRHAILKPAADEMELPLIKIDSNIHEIIGAPFQLTSSIRNMAPVLLLQKLLGKYYYASSFTYDDCYVGEAYDMAYADPITLHMLSTETTEISLSGAQFARVEKVKQLVDVEITHRFLDVCIRPDAAGNCSTCWKCARTILTLEILGYAERYAEVFDLDKYRKIRTRFIGQIMSSNDPLNREVIELARQREVPLPIASRFIYKPIGFLMPNAVRRKLSEIAIEMKWV